jgi:cell wall-associated NlpC family hydrolase
MTGKKLLLIAGVAGFAFVGSATPALHNVSAIKNPNEILKTENILDITKEKRNYAMMQKVVKYLISRVDKTPYVFSGSSTHGWDCSGLVRWTYKRFGLDIPHSADKQGHIGVRVSRPAIGDIVVFAYEGSRKFYHSAIYAGQNRVINANLMYGTTVLQPLTDYKNSQIRFVRVINQKKTQLILGEK